MSRLRGAWPVLALVVLGAVPRWLLTGQSLFRDELSTSWLASMGLGDLLRTVTDRMEITPPLSFVASWAATAVAGAGPHALRVPALVAGLAAIPLVHALGVRTVGRRAALLAAALTAAAPFTVWYSAEARAYGPLVALSAATALAALLALDTGRTRWWGLYGLGTAAVAFTHYTGVFVLAVLFGWLLLHPQARRPATLAVGGAVLLYLPWALTGLRHDLASPDADLAAVFVDFTPRGVLTAVAHWAAGHPNPNIGFRGVPGIPALVALVLAIVAAAAGLLARRPGRPPGRVLLVAALAVAAPAGELVTSAVSSPSLTPNSLASSWPGFALALAALLLAPGPRLRVATAGLGLAAFVAGGVQVARPVHGRPDFGPGARIAEAAGPAAVVVDGTGGYFGTPGPLTPLDAELRRPARIVRVGVPQERTGQFVVGGPAPVTPAAAVAAARRLVGDGPIVVVSPGAPPPFLDAFEAQLRDAGIGEGRRVLRRDRTRADLGDVVTVVWG